MKTRPPLAWALMATLAAPTVALGESFDPKLRTSGKIWTEWAVDTHYDKSDLAAEDWLETLTRFEMESRWQTEGGGRWVLGVNGVHGLRSGDETEVDWAVHPEKVYWEKSLTERVHVRLGQQIARWGKLEASPIVDILNPRDLRYGPLLPLDDSRVPIPMASLDWGPPALHAQFILIPFHVPARYQMVGSDWAFFPIGTWEDMLASSLTWGGDPYTTALFQTLLGAFNLRMEEAEPSQWWALDQAMATSGAIWRPFGGVEGAARLAWELPHADGSFMLGYVREDYPTVTLANRLVGWMLAQSWPSVYEFQDWVESGSRVINTDYPYTGMLGLDAATSLGSFGFRGEFGAFSNRGLTTRTLQATTSPEIAGGLAVEYTGSTTVGFGTELTLRRLLAMDEPVLNREEQEVTVSGFLRLSLFRERLKPRLALLWDPLREEGLATGELTWRPRDAFSLGVHGFFFIAPVGTPRTLEELMTWEGGGLGMYSDNDAVALKMTWYL